jgi:hypothetical protein
VSVSQVADLEEKVVAQERHTATLQARQVGTDAARRESLANKMGFVGAYGSGELPRAGVSGAVSTLSAVDVLDDLHDEFHSPAERSRTLGKQTSGPKRTGVSDFERLRYFEAYSRLFAAEDAASKETFAEWDREAVRSQMHRALSQHVLMDDGGERRRYFNLTLNRVRSATTHNVFDRFGDYELEQLVLLFARFDTDHDGVLEFGDFCRVMLLIGGRVGATYHEKQMKTMFGKVHANTLLRHLAVIVSSRNATLVVMFLVHPAITRATLTLTFLRRST